MNTVIEQLDEQISLLQQARAVLGGLSAPPEKRGPGRPKGVVKPLAKTKRANVRTLSADGKARIAAAQKLRWAKSKKALKKSY